LSDAHGTRYQPLPDLTEAEARLVRERFNHCWDNPEPSGCWLWKGSKTQQGYGRFTIARQRYMAHRVALILYKGRVAQPNEMVCHTCDTPACVNPDHLWIGTAKSNAEDMSAKGRQVTHPGEAHWAARLTAGQVVAIRETFAEGRATMRSLASLYGVCSSDIKLIVRGHIWQTAGGPISPASKVQNQYTRNPPTHCKRGHEFTPENTRLYAGRRHCRACACIRDREYRADARKWLEGRP
jgi:hypothetical protein